MAKREIFYEGDMKIEKWTDCDDGGFELSFECCGRYLGWCDRYPGEPEEIGINVQNISEDKSLSPYKRALEGENGRSYKKMFDYLGTNENSNIIIFYPYIGGQKNG